ncbi:MAG: PQQ-binding-like beta-propeller repeat protein [Phycisphaerae bacterium]|nr:PQQ-binding-like beta-propeller repeat protein [Phycisphaerae bacterium]
MKSGCYTLLIYVAAATALLLAWRAERPGPGATAGSRATGTARRPAAITRWVHYRGDTGQRGVSQARLPQNPKLLWTFATGGAIKSSPVIAGGRAYIGSDDGMVYALDLRTGKKIWQFKTPHEDPVEAPPTLHGDRLFVGDVGGFMYALDASDGKLIWKHEAQDKIVGAANVIPGKTGSALVVFGAHDGVLYGLDAATGKQAWAFEISDPINGSPAVSRGRSIFGGCDGALHVVSTDNGQSVRSVDVGDIIAGSAALDGHVAFTPSFGQEVLAVDIEAGKVLWRYRDRNFEYYSSPAVTSEVIVFGGRDKRVHCVDRKTGTARWTFSARGRVDSSPVIAGNRVVVGSHDGRLYILDLATGEPTWTWEVGGRISGAPAIVDGWIIIGNEDGSVYGFSDHTPAPGERGSAA